VTSVGALSIAGALSRGCCSYQPPFEFTGTLNQVTMEAK
jgi:hypothetical protein